ncbi:glycerol-3-phosphate dehydrogenase/oxidase [Chryseolinea sp. H1M3-3]|uniref:glycerol-3-phosphate dehydrogenase/oxidase n=1 Tax=Chryseolinea sp. H1M3-3 TaxID=3034144 RepID=UPI0023ED96FD|nr:glycerol-3-phosphate dehydrogenase/oxidase [Chryseolinea sp. H1M3-3]
MIKFSFSDRQAIMNKLSTEHYDLLVIGGGITGAGIALDAASRGLKTALVEKNDFAFGTSSRSTKLIHGGLRYLKQLEFGLVKEVGSERAIVHRLAPHLVIPEKMLLPLSEKKGLGYGLTSIGLKIYDWLAGVKAEDQRKMLTKPQTLKYEPLLKKDDVKGGAIYAEYRTDDARLTIEIVKTAAAEGADLLSYARAEEFIYENGNIVGAKIADQLSNNFFAIRATVTVNAAGPWVDELRDINKSKEGKWLHLTKGVHIVLPRAKLPVKQAIYFNVDDGRMIFAIPRGRTTYVGTTDTFYDGDKDRVFTTRQDAEYLIAAVNTNFPSVTLGLSDVESSWAGLRPLIHEEGKSASELSRKDEIFESPSRLISIAGGKLTGYRKMAERVVNLVIKKYFEKKSLKECRTHLIKLGGNAFKDGKEVKKFVLSLTDKLKDSNLPPHTASYLVENYGQQVVIILDHWADRDTQENPELSLLKAELIFCIQYEMVCTLADFFVRRTGLINFDIQKVIRCKTEIAEVCKIYLGWSNERVSKELNELDQLIASITAFSK